MAGRPCWNISQPRDTITRRKPKRSGCCSSTPAPIGASWLSSIGIAPSANLNPDRTSPSLFEAVHGSAPDIYGKGIANPIGQIWSGALMLEHLGHPDAAAAVVGAIERVLADPSAPRTPDIGGKATTEDVGKAIAAAV